MIQTSNFDRILENVESLSNEEKEALIDLVQKRLAENRRSEIAENIIQTKQEYVSGQVFRGTVDEAIAELDA